MLMSKSRLEKFLYALYSLDSSDLPNPLSRIEELYKCLVTGEELPTFEPLSRVEKYLMAILGVYDVDSLPNPLSRVEVLLYKLATGDDNLDDVKSFLSEHEELLAEIIRNGGVGGNIDIEYVLYTLSTEFNTLYNTAEKPVKSAILKGNTLVNLLTQFMSSVKYVDSQYRIDFKNVGNFDKITVVNKNSKPIKFLYYTNTWHSCQISAFNNALVEIPEEVVTYYISVSNITGWDSANYREATDNIVLLHGDYVNQDIPYFEGMQSVNLYPNQTIKKITWSSGRYYTETGTLTSVNATANHKYFEDYFDVLPNHTLRVIGNNTTKYLNFYDESKTFISRSTLTSTGDLVATVPSNARYYRYSMLVNSGMTDETVIYDEDMKINIADTSIDSDYLQKMGVLQTSNEDGTKTNILTVNETVELRKVGEVKDELDLLTGEVTRRVGELVLDGSTDVNIRLSNEYTNTIRYQISTNDAKTRANAISSAFIYEMSDSDNEHFRFDGGGIGAVMLYISKTKATNVDELRTWLSNNPLTIHYELGGESIEGTNLATKDQDGNNTELSTFNDITHVTLSSEGLIPEAELEVATKNEEVLNTLSLEMDDISATQTTLEETSNTQSENVDATMIATTEIYEELL